MRAGFSGDITSYTVTGKLKYGLSFFRCICSVLVFQFYMVFLHYQHRSQALLSGWRRYLTILVPLSVSYELVLHTEVMYQMEQTVIGSTCG